MSDGFLFFFAYPTQGRALLNMNLYLHSIGRYRRIAYSHQGDLGLLLHVTTLQPHTSLLGPLAFSVSEILPM